MSQELHVLQCYSCETFQVHIVKKTNKWDCKICGERQSIKKVFGRGSGKDCRAHVQRLNEERRRKETFVLNRRIQFQCAENAVAAEINIPSVKSSKWDKYLSEDEDDDDDDDHSDDSMPVSPSELGIRSTSEVCKQQTIQNYFASGPVNSTCGKKISVVPESLNEKLVHCSETPFNVNEGIPPQDSESSLRYFSTQNYNYNDYKTGGTNCVHESQRNSSLLCFDLLPETLTTTALLNCDSQQKILSDISSDSFATCTSNGVFGKKQFPATDVKDINPTKSGLNKQEEGKIPVQLQSDSQGSYITDLGREAINSEKNVKQIFSDIYNEDELDEILKF